MRASVALSNARISSSKSVPRLSKSPRREGASCRVAPALRRALAKVDIRRQAAPLLERDLEHGRILFDLHRIRRDDEDARSFDIGLTMMAHNWLAWLARGAPRRRS